MVEEIWRTAVYDDVVYEGLYEVSNLGRIMSLNYKGTGRAELMKLGNHINGYLQVQLSKNGIIYNCLVHRLVAQTFLPNPENKPCVNHKIEGDKGKTMNMVIFNEDGSINKEKSTIEWVTVKENNNYESRNQRIAKAQSKTVLQFTLDGRFIREWESTMECERNGFHHSAVCKCCNGKLPHYKGFKWCYA